jgi:DNA-binding transcriptional MerR regulator
MTTKKPVHDSTEWHTAAVAARLSGLSVAMVNYLCRQGLVEPSCKCPRGHGTKRHYSFGDIIALRLIRELSQVGVSPTRLRGGLRALRKHHPEITLTSLPATHVATDGKHLVLCRPGQSVERLIDGQMSFAFVVDLGPLQTEVARKLKRA